ncbi:hypothetical protein PU629_03520 [Pullulanibacillus sp. KACC 23026]|uniref:hypothetical protein n=1 Tax=Pullulanibacillus sp. KACC 23026 TaxID=3028315 RepID=UPI0023B0B9DF|nr:hypothetical protein [Pullulanibacillus sp. KACC 23026]WEG13451.1 hypothetical protein PU629_03520 [Pullulanibacillus sp. KACC 23026]
MSKELIYQALEEGEGILNLVPNFVPRRFGEAGFRLRLHPDDYYPYGLKRGAIKERWFSSVVNCINGDDAPEDEGLSYVALLSDSSKRFLFKEAVEVLGAQLIGKELYQKHGTWPMFAKFFDFKTPLFHHIHLMQHHADLVGKMAKPEAYYFPFQLNSYSGEVPVTYFGFDPSVTKEEVKERLLQFEETDNRITELSRAFRIQLGTGWYVPAGVVHAPGSLLTYEPQLNSDVNAVVENVVAADHYPYDFLVENVPEEKKRDIDFIMSLMDWEKNIDPEFRKHYFRPPLHAAGEEGIYEEKWISYGNEYIAAKELTIQPCQTVSIKDSTAYGCILIQGHGKFGVYNAEAAHMIRFGQMTADEFFVSEDRAKDGVVISNHSISEPLVILKHFSASTNKEVPQL